MWISGVEFSAAGWIKKKNRGIISEVVQNSSDKLYLQADGDI